MDWSNERYVRLYTRDTTDWCLWSWQAQALFVFILRKVDRAGVLDLGRHGINGLSAHVKMPWDVVEPALQELLRDGCVEVDGPHLVVRNFIDAQEVPQSDAERQRASREKRRDMARKADVVTNRDGESRNVTKCHALSRAVTSCHSEPSEPSEPICAAQTAALQLPGLEGPGRREGTRETDARVKPVIDRYVARFKDRTGADYPGRYQAAGEAIRRLPRSYTAEVLVSLVDEFWDDPDPFIVEKNGARIEAWVSRIGAQLAKRNGRWRSHAPAGRDWTQERLTRERAAADMAKAGAPDGSGGQDA